MALIYLHSFFSMFTFSKSIRNAQLKKYTYFFTYLYYLFRFPIVALLLVLQILRAIRLLLAYIPYDELLL